MVESGGDDWGRGQRLLTSVKDEDRGVVPGPEAEWKTTLKIFRRRESMFHERVWKLGK